ncbi:MAG: TonB-dependent receptor [Planctomycetes bacterium]|nr:TonB-dependent receptor [Planctomycetota bacterium]
MRKFLITASLVFLAAFSCLPASPQEASPPDIRVPDLPTADDDEPETIVVTATRLETPVWETASSVDVILPQDADRAMTPESARIMEKVPGMRFAPQGTPGQQTSLFTRGGESDHTLLLQDGIRVNDQDSYLDFGRITSAGNGVVEIVRGTGSMLYGSDAMTGTVSAQTMRGEGPWHLTGTMHTGSWGSCRNAVTYSGSEGPAALALGVDTYCFGGTVPNSDYRQETVFGRGDFTPGGSTELTVVYRSNSVESGWYTNNSTAMGPGVPGTFLDPNDRILGEDALGSATLGRFFGERYTLKLTAGAFRFNRFYESVAPNDTSGFTPAGTTDMRLNRSQVNVSNEFLLDRRRQGRLLVGFEYLDDSFKEVDTRWGSDIDAGRFNSAVFAEYHFVPARGTSAVTAGARLEDNSQFGEFTSCRLSAVQRFGPENNLALRGSIGKAFRCPSYSELYYPFSGNPSLQVEENLGFDAGFDFAFPASGVSGSIVYYSNSFDNMVKFDMMSFTFQNIGEAESSGVEASCSFRSENLPFSLKAALTTSSAQDSTGTELLRRPALTASLSAEYSPSDKLAVGLSAVKVGEWQDLDETYATITMDGYTRFDAFVEWKAAENMTVFARCENIADDYYEPVYSFPALGRTFMIGIRAEVGF